MFFSLFSITSASEKDNGLLWSSKGQSSIRIHKNGETILKNHQYLYTKCLKYKSDKFSHLVVSQQAVWRRGDWEGNDPFIEATGFIIEPGGREKKLWTISEKAEEGFLSCDFYKTVWYGCCTLGQNNRLYHLKTGKLVNEYNRDLLTIEIPNTPIKRYIGYKPVETIHHYPWENDNTHIGTLTYSSPSQILHRVAIRGRGAGYEDEFGLGFAELSLIPGKNEQKLHGNHSIDLPFAASKNDPELITAFKIKLEFFDISIQIPVVKDTFLLIDNEFYSFEIVSE